MRRAGVGLAGQCPRVAKSRQHPRAGLGLTRAVAARGPSKPTGVDAVKGFATWGSRWTTHRKSKDSRAWGLESSCPCSPCILEMVRYPHSHKAPLPTAAAPSAICSSIYITVFSQDAWCFLFCFVFFPSALLAGQQVNSLTTNSERKGPGWQGLVHRGRLQRQQQMRPSHSEVPRGSLDSDR